MPIGTIVPNESDQREAIARMSRVHGEGELRASILALVMLKDTPPVEAAWVDETADVPAAGRLRADAQCLDERMRLPMVEALLERLRALPKLDRRPVLKSYRRLMAAVGPVRPVDRLQWLHMRRRLGERPPTPLVPTPHVELTRLPLEMREQVAVVTAYLSRIVPDGRPFAGGAWRDAVITRFMPQDDALDRSVPDADRLVHAFQEVSGMPWMLRPVLMRAWVDCAIALHVSGRLPRQAADALRLAATLLDSPLPPTLARCFLEVEWAGQESHV